MNRDEFLAQLRQELRDIPLGDAEDALRYYSEYFDDAGEENEQQTLRELGSPAAVAAQIKANCAYRTMQQQPQSTRQGCSAVLMGVLAVFAAPIAIPLLIAGIVVLFALGLVAVCLFGSFLLVVGILLGAGVLVLLCPFWLVMSGVTTAYYIGCGLVLLGLSVFAAVGMVYAVRWAVNLAANLLYKVLNRKERTPHV